MRIAEISERTPLSALQEIAMTYIPATDAAVYKTSAITRMVAGKEEEERPPPQPPQPPLQPPTIEKANGGGTTVISIGGGGGPPPAQKGSGGERARCYTCQIARILAWWIGLSRTMGLPSTFLHCALSGHSLLRQVLILICCTI